MSMLAAQVQSHTDPGKHPCELKNVSKPVPKEHEVLVQVKASGCCFTDLHAIMGDWPAPVKLPLIPGHEGIGIVVEKGSSVKAVEVGDRVGIGFLHSACGSCEYCISGWETICMKQTNSGYNTDGCMSQFVLGDGNYVAKIPEQISNEQAAPILCAGVTVYKAIKETEARPGQFITIVGAAGGLGHLAIQYAKAMGLRVIAVDLGAEKKAFCESLGAELSIDLGGDLRSEDELVERVVNYTNGGSHAVLLVATQPGIYSKGVAMCRRKGTVVCVGIMGADVHIPIPDLVLRCITVRGSIIGTRQDTREALDFAARGLIKVHVHTAPLDQINEVYSEMNQGHVKGRNVLQL